MTTKSFLLFLVSSLAFPSPQAADKPVAPEYILFEDLFRNYSSYVRPKLNSSETMEVEVSYILSSVNHVSEKQQSVTYVGWVSLSWRDDLLIWDPAEYDNISAIVVNSDKIWLPDVSFSGGIDKLFFELDGFRPQIQSDGAVSFQAGGPITLSCNLILTDFPFDVQTCPINLHTWSSTDFQVRMSAGELTREKAGRESGEWEIVGTGARQEIYTEGTNTFTQVFFEVRLRRKPLYHIMNMLLPVVLLSLLNLTVFHLPPESEEKISLAINVLLAFSVWLLMLNDNMPSTSDHVPLIAIYLTIFMTISAASVTLTVYVIRIHHTDKSKPVPNWIRKLLLYRRSTRTRPLKARKTTAGKQNGTQDTSVPVKDDGAADDNDYDVDDNEPAVTWVMVSSTIDSVAYYISLMFILVLMAVVGGHFLTSS